MSEPRQPASLSEVEIDRLEALLESPAFGDKAMMLDAMQGFFCSIVSGPELILPSTWLPVVLGEDTQQVPMEVMRETLDLVMRFYNDAALALDGGKGITFIHYPSARDGGDDYATWCQGYLEGVDCWPEAWEERDDADAADELLFPIVALADEMTEQARRGLKAGEWEQLQKTCREDFVNVVFRIHHYWRAHRDQSPPVRRAGPKVGRNELCPCGSGKKFKHCCGSPGAMH